MSLDLELILILLLAGVVGGFIDSAVGGGGLIRLPVLLATGIPPHIALGTNKMGATGASFISSIQYWRSGQVHKPTAAIGFVVAIAAAMLGVLTITSLNESLVLLLVFFALLGLFLYVLVQPNFGRRDTPRMEKLLPIAVALALVFGFYDGLLGPGTGNFLIAGYVVLAGFGFKRAAANARIINFGSNVGALTLFALLGLIDYRIGVPLILANAVGGRMGSTFALRYGTSFLRPLFLIASLLLLGKLAYDLFL